MTAAGGGIPGFGYSDTSVAAKLSLDIPGDSVEILKNIAMWSNDAASNMQASARFGAEFMQYLQMMPQIQRQVLDMQKDWLQTLRDTDQVMSQLRGSSTGFNPGFMPQAQASGMQQGMYNGGGADRYNTVRSVPNSVSSSPSSQVNPMAGMTDSQITSYIQQNGAVFDPFGYGPMGGGAHRLPPGASMRNIPGNRHDTSRPDSISDNSQAAARDRENEIERQRVVRDRTVRTGNPAGSVDRSAAAQDWRRRNGIPEPDEDRADPSPAPGTPDAPDTDRAPSGGSRGAHPPAPDERRSHGGWHGILNDAINTFNTGTQALGPDGTPLAGRAALGERVLGGAANALRGIPGAGALGVAGLGIGALGVGFNAVQGVGEKVQAYRNMDVHGHDFSTGVGVEKDVMALSLNPLISTEQSREIIMGAMNSGRTGKSYDTAVDFIKDNLVNMNMAVNDSVQLLTTNVELGRQSLGGLKLDLSNIAGIAAGGGKTMEETQKEYSSFSDYFIQTAGDTSGKAGQTATSFVGNFAQKEPDGSPNPLAEHTADIFEPIFQSQSALAMLTKYVPGSTVNNVQEKLSGMGGNAANQAVQNVMETYAKQANMTKGTLADKQDQFYLILQGQKINMRRDLANQFFVQLMEGVEDPEKSYAAESASFIGSLMDNPVTLNGKTTQASDMLTQSQWLAQPANAGKTADDYDTAMGFAKDSTIGIDKNGNALNQGARTAQVKGFDAKAIDKITATGENVVAIDPDGKAHYVNKNDREQIIGLANGSWRLQQTTLSTNGSMGPNRDSNNAILGNSDLVGGDGSLTNAQVSGARLTEKTFLVSNGFQSGSVDEGAANNDITSKTDAEGNTTISAPTADGTGSSPVLTIVMNPDVKSLFQLSGSMAGTVQKGAGPAAANAGINGKTPNALDPGTTVPQARTK